MSGRARIRKSGKWGGAVVTVLLAVVWVGSGWFWAGRTSGSFNVGVMSGCLSVRVYLAGFDDSGQRSIWDAGVIPPTFLGMPIQRKWWFSRTNEMIAIRYAVPIWAPAGVALVITAAAWGCDTLARRRARMNLCQSCTYDRSGLAGGAVCPECGSGGLPA